MDPICGYSTAKEGLIGTVIDELADGSEQKMTHTVYRGWYNASLGVLLADGRISRIDKSCCGADGMDLIHRRKDKRWHTSDVYDPVKQIRLEYSITILHFDLFHGNNSIGWIAWKMRSTKMMLDQPK